MCLTANVGHKTMKRAIILLGTLLLSGCSTVRDVSLIHPHRSTILGPHQTTRELYLYRNDPRSASFSVSEHDHIATHQYKGNALQEVRIRPDIVLPPGSTILVSQIIFVDPFEDGPYLAVLGVATDTKNATRYSVDSLIEPLSLGVTLEQWRKDNHRVFATPPVSEYLEESRVSDLNW